MNVFLFFLLFSTFPLFCENLSEVKQLFREGKYEAALDVLYARVEKGDPDFDTLEMMGDTAFEMTETAKNKKTILAVIEKATSVLSQFVDHPSYSNPEKARILHKYNALIAKKAQQLNPLDSLKILPEIFDNAEKTIQLDPSFSEPYFIMLAVDDAAPAIIGDPSKRGENSKHRIGINLIKTLKGDPDNLYFLVEGAAALLNRNWSSEQKRKTAKKEGFDDTTPQNLSDKEYAKELLERAVSVYPELDSPARIETEKYQKALSLLKKL